MHKTLRHFDALTAQGLRIIPLRPLSKIPVSKGWVNWNKELCRDMLVKNPEYNIGLLLGEIIDVEGDSKEANDKISELIGDYQHPSYASTKSIHHLFINPDQQLTILKHQDIEFRASRHQSVLPPSVLENTTSYRWLAPIQFPIPPMPDRLLQFFLDMKRWKLESKTAVKPGHVGLHCYLCKKECFLHRKRFTLEVIAFKELGMRWTCHNCRKVDVRSACRRIRSETVT